MPTKIRKEQIRIEDFIQALNSVDWTSDTLTASAAAIKDQINASIAGVTGAMQYRGAWANVTTETAVKQGYVYIYTGTGPTFTNISLESGDMLVATVDGASYTDYGPWTIVQANITGAVTEAGLSAALYDVLQNGNSNSLTITRDASNNKLKLTVKFPTIQDGTAASGYYIAGMSINPTTGKISITKSALPTQVDYGKRLVLDAACLGTVDGSNTVFTTPAAMISTMPYRASLYINGVKQHSGTDYTLTINVSGLGTFSLSASAYIPQTGDLVTCDYVAAADVTA